jgi:hypothetical protein
LVKRVRVALNPIQEGAILIVFTVAAGGRLTIHSAQLIQIDNLIRSLSRLRGGSWSIGCLETHRPRRKVG